MTSEGGQITASPESPRAHARTRCAGTTQAGERCRGKALPGGEFCFYHDPESDFTEASRVGGLHTQARRSVRERFREDAERVYETLFTKLLEAVESEIVRWGDCPNCKHKVPVSFPDVRARTQAIQVLLDQGYGKPTERVAIESSAQDDMRKRIEAMSREERERLRVGIFARYVADVIKPAGAAGRRDEKARAEIMERITRLSPEQLERLRGGMREAVGRELEAAEASEGPAPEEKPALPMRTDCFKAARAAR